MILRAIRRRSLDWHETNAQIVVGLLINWPILWFVYGEPMTGATVSAVMIGVSWVRSRLIRAAFRKLGS